MTDFKDKIGRLIKIDVSVDRADAYHEGKKIGFVETSGIREGENYLQDEPAHITGWGVDQEYRRSGIATALVRALVVEMGMLAPAPRNLGYSGQNTLTDDGEFITRHCQMLGLIYPHPADEHEPDYSEKF